MRQFLKIALLPLLAGCATLTGTENHLMPETLPAERVQVAARGIEIQTVDLPAYAADTKMAVANSNNVVKLSASNVWADEPPRGITQRLASQLAQRVSAAVAAEPWPMLSRPDLRIAVKVDQLVGGETALTFSGQYFVTAANTGTYEGAYQFSYAIPYPDPEGDVYQNIAAAQSEAIAQLAADMAVDLAAIPSASVIGVEPQPLF